MALIGEPYLVCWTPSDNSLRLYRKAGDSFVQLASRGSITRIDGQPYPRPAFLPNGVLTYSVNFTDQRLAQLVSTTGIDLTPVDTVDVLAPSLLARHQAYPIQTKAPTTGLNLSRGGYRVHRVVADGDMPNNGFGYFRYTSNGIRQATNIFDTNLFGASGHIEVVAPNGHVEAFTRNDPTVYQIRSLSENGTYDGVIDVQMPKSDGSDIKGLNWSDDSRLLFVLGAQVNELAIVDVDLEAGSASVVGTVTVPGHVTCLARYGSFLAVGTAYLVEGVPNYRTYIYRKSNYMLAQINVLEGIGNDILWTPDGAHLIDASNKSAYDFDGLNFAENTDLMVNIAAGVTVSAISGHRPIAYRNSLFYDGAISYFGLDNVPSPLKVLLLSNGAFFDHTDSLVSQVTGAGSFEVHGFEWPEGGKDVSNVQRTVTSDSITWIADEVSQGIVGGELVATAALIYSEDTPLIYVDFGEELTFNANEILRMDFSSGFAWLGFN